MQHQEFLGGCCALSNVRLLVRAKQASIEHPVYFTFARQISEHLSI